MSALGLAADMIRQRMNVRAYLTSGHEINFYKCLLLTHSGHPSAWTLYDRKSLFL